MLQCPACLWLLRPDVDSFRAVGPQLLCPARDLRCMASSVWTNTRNTIAKGTSTWETEHEQMKANEDVPTDVVMSPTLVVGSPPSMFSHQLTIIMLIEQYRGTEISALENLYLFRSLLC